MNKLHLLILPLTVLLCPSALLNCACNNNLNSDSDRDFDGLNDSIDPDPNNNQYKVVLNLGLLKNSKEIDLTIDYRDFIKDGYSKSLSTYASLMINAINGSMPSFVNNVYTPSSKTIFPIFSQIGCEDITYLNLEPIYRNQEDPYDIGATYIAHHTFKDENNKKHQVFFNAIHGYPSNVGWISNFDVGAINQDGSLTDGYKQFWGTKNTHIEWTHRNYHKGFDVTANRLMKAINEYIGAHENKEATKTIIFAGHSRAGALANLLAKSFIDEGNDARAYCFNPPPVSKEENDENKYHNIFTFTNKNDIVSRVPCPNYWGYSLYGKPFVIDVNSEGKKLHQELFNEEYTCNSDDTLDKIEEILADLTCTEKPTGKSGKTIKDLASSNNAYEFRYKDEDSIYDCREFSSEEEALTFKAELDQFINKHCFGSAITETPIEIDDGFRVNYKTKASLIINFMIDILAKGNFDEDTISTYLILLNRLVGETIEKILTGELELSIEGFASAHVQRIACLLSGIVNNR